MIDKNMQNNILRPTGTFHKIVIQIQILFRADLDRPQFPEHENIPAAKKLSELLGATHFRSINSERLYFRYENSLIQWQLHIPARGLFEPGEKIQSSAEKVDGIRRRVMRG